MKPLIRFALRQSVLVNILFVAMVIAGAVLVVPFMAVDRYPNIKFGEVMINTPYPGASAEEVERLVTDEIEDALRGMEDIDFVKSTSRADQSEVFVKFVDDTDYDALYDELRIRVQGIQNILPRINGQPLAPQFGEVDVDEWLPVVQVSLLAPPGERLRSRHGLVLLAEQLRTRLEAVPGVKETVLTGDMPEQYVIAIDPAALRRHKLTFAAVSRALQASGDARPVTTMDTAVGERLIRVDQRYRSPEDVVATVVRRDGDGNVVRVADVIANGETGLQRIEGGVIATINGRDAVTVKVLKLANANVITVKEAVDREVAAFLASRPDAQIEVIETMDGTKVIDDGLGVLVESLMLSAILVMALLFGFLARITANRTIIGTGLAIAAIAVVLAVPVTAIQIAAVGVMTIFVAATCRAAVLTVSGIVFSFLGALSIFHFFGYSINEISLLGFVLVSGIVVDDAVVVLENIQRHRESGKTLKDAVVDGTAEVFWPVTSATLTTVAAFLPMLLMTGAVGDFFSQVPKAVSAVLAISLLECLFILPIHVLDLRRLFGPDRNIRPHNDGAHTGLLGWLDRRYTALLQFNLRHPLLVIGGVALAVVAAVGVLVQSQTAPLQGETPLVKNKFFPDDTSVVDVVLRLPSGTPMSETDALTRRISAHLAGLGPGLVTSATGLAGMTIDKAYRPVYANQYAIINIEVPSREERTFTDLGAYIEGLREEVYALVPDHARFIEVAARQGGPPTGAPVNVRLSGLDDVVLDRMADSLTAWLRAEGGADGAVPGVRDVYHDRERRTAVLAFSPDRARTAIFDLEDAQVQSFVAGALGGAYVGEYRRLNEDIPINLRLSRGSDVDPLALVDVPMVEDGRGRVVRFSDVGRLEASEEPAALIRRDFQRTVTITGNLSKDAQVDATSLRPIIQRWADQRSGDFPGVALAFGGEAESTGKSFRSLAIAFVIAIALIYAILAAQFRSYAQPLLIMSNIVFSFCGVVFGLAVFGAIHEAFPGLVAVERSYFTVQSFIAIVGLAGLVVNDAIVLIDFINRHRGDGLPVQEALVTAGRQRMRAIVLTTLTTIAGLLPMAVGLPEFSITWGPFATSFITGLIFATLMTLLVVPVLYQTLERTIAGATAWAARRLPPGESDHTGDERAEEVHA